MPNLVIQYTVGTEDRFITKCNTSTGAIEYSTVLSEGEQYDSESVLNIISNLRETNTEFDNGNPKGVDPGM